MIPGKTYRLEDLIAIGLRRKWLILVPFVLIATATFIGAKFLPNSYRSSTLILVVPQRVPESYVRSTITARIEDRLQSIQPQILSRPRLERIITDFNLYTDLRKYATTEDVVDRMRKDILVQVVKGDAFSISYVANEPRTAMRVVERLASWFIDENRQDREVLAEGTNQFLGAQLEDARRRLIEQEQKLQHYRNSHPDDLPALLNSNLQGQHNAEMQVQALVDSLNIDRDRRLVLERQLADASVAGSNEEPLPARTANPDGSVRTEPGATAADQLKAAQATLQNLELRLKPEHPDIVRVKRLIADLEKKVSAEGDRTPVKSTPSPAQLARESKLNELRLELASVSRQIAAKEEQEKHLRQTIGMYQTRIQAVPAREAEIAELTRDYETMQQLYRGLLAKNEDSKVSANLERRQIGEQFKVIEPAQLPETPFSPNRLRIDLIGAIAGLAFGLGLVGLLEYADTSMRSEEDVAVALDLPVLALFPFVESETDRRKRLRVHVALAVTVAATMVLSIAGMVWKLRP